MRTTNFSRCQHKHCVQYTLTSSTTVAATKTADTDSLGSLGAAVSGQPAVRVAGRATPGVVTVDGDRHLVGNTLAGQLFAQYHIGQLNVKR